MPLPNREPPPALFREWEKKLEAEGLVDANCGERFQGREHAGSSTEQASYYAWCRAMYHEWDSKRKWKDQLDRQIWELHAEGVHDRAVASRLGVGRRLVQTRILRVRTAMKRRAKWQADRPMRSMPEAIRVEARIPDEQHALLMMLATRLRVSSAELVRRAVALWLYEQTAGEGPK